jgi:hypothetical protein
MHSERGNGKCRIEGAETIDVIHCCEEERRRESCVDYDAV